MLPQPQPTKLSRLRSLLLVPVILAQRPRVRKLQTPRHHGRKSLVRRDRLRSPTIIKMARMTVPMMVRTTADTTKVRMTAHMMVPITDKF